MIITRNPQLATVRATTQPSTPTPKYTRKRTEICMSEDLSLYIRGNIVHTMKLGNYANVHQFDEQKAADGIFM